MTGNTLKIRRPVALAVLAALNFAPATEAASPNIVISQVYGGGGNSGATLKNDFIELFNRGATAVSLSGMSVQYGAATGSTWQVTNLSNVTLQPGQYYLVQEAVGAGGTLNLPTPDATGTIAMGGSAGKVALVSSTTALSGACPTTNVVDIVGYGPTANCAEGNSPTAILANTTAALRASSGCTDTDNNSSDFAVLAPSPRNTASALNVCSSGGNGNPTVSLFVSANSGSEAGQTAITVTASASAAVSGAQTVNLAVSGSGITTSDYTLNNAAASSITLTIPDGSTSATATFKVLDDADAEGTETAVLTLSNPSASISLGSPATQNISIADNEASPGACAAPDTLIGQIQGSGTSAALTGTQTVQGVVVGDFEFPGTGTSSDYLRGFYLQDAGDGNPATSDGIFIFNNNLDSVSLGQVVQVTGNVSDYAFGSTGGTQTQITATTIENCGGTGSVTPVDVNLPFGTTTSLERYEGMLVRFPQTLYVSEHFQLGRFGQVLLSSGKRLSQPTNVTTPGAAALALQAQNDLNQITLDDELQQQNPDPIRFGRGVNPLSAANTLRGGDTVSGLTGVLTQTDATTASNVPATSDPVIYRLRPTNALNGTAPNFQAANPRPTIPAQVNGRLKVVSANLLNFFNTFTSCTYGVGGTAADCRGAENTTEYDRQWKKTVKNLVGTGAAVLMVNEMENDGYGASSAIADLVNKLDAEAGATGTYRFINPDLVGGQNALGTDAIKVGIIYKPALVTPVGTTAPLNTGALGLFHTGAGDIGRSRPSLAQAFEENATGARFIAVANHLKSKGSACSDNTGLVTTTLSTTSVIGDTDAADGQGECNKTRTAAAEELVNLLLTDPTATNDPDILIAGDLNAYAKENPVTALKNAGYINLIESRIGALGYSYVFDGQWGYLDYALASPSLNAQIAGVLEWHINADEPNVLDYNTNFKTAGQQALLWAQDAFRTSDHDPIVVGLNLNDPNLQTRTGTAGADNLVGSSGRDALIGLAGRDTLTGGANRDQFVFNTIQDGIDTITDFTVNFDTIVLTSVLQSLGVPANANPLADGYVVCTASGSNSLLSIDPDAVGPALKRSLVVVNNVSCAALNAAANFAF